MIVETRLCFGPLPELESVYRDGAHGRITANVCSKSNARTRLSASERPKAAGHPYPLNWLQKSPYFDHDYSRSPQEIFGRLDVPPDAFIAPSGMSARARRIGDISLIKLD